MGNKIFFGVVLLLWGSSMSWLLVAKILPPYYRGDPPRASTTSRLEPVAWRIEIEGRPCGLSVSQAVPGALSTTEVHSRVKLQHLPLPQLTTQWLWIQSLLKDIDDIRLDLRTRSTFDSFDRLSSFETRLQANELPPMAKVTGRVTEGKLELVMRAGDYSHRSEHAWKGRSLLGGELSPEPRLLPVYVGRSWREEVYSPFAAPGSRAEIIEAEVVSEDLIRHNDQMVQAKQIVYRSLSSAGVSASDRVRAIVWVVDTGEVIRQDLYFMSTSLRFTRLDPVESEKLAESMLELDQYATTFTPNRPSKPSR